MKGISRRTRACAVVAATGVAVLAGAAAASAQDRPASVGDGIPTGQMSVQMFNYGGFISNGGNTGPASPITPESIKPAADGSSCATATSQECRMNRLEALFALLQSKGVTSIEMFGHAGFPAATDTAGLQAYRALLDKYGLHAAGQHGTLTATVNQTWRDRVAAGKILGADALGSGGYGSPGIGSYANTLQTAENLNAIGKYSVEQGVGPVYVHNHTGEFDAKYMDNGELKTAMQIITERTDPRYVFIELDVFWSSDAFNDVTGTASAALINQFPNRIKMLHIKDGINIEGQPSPTNSRSGSPRATGTGELDFRPILTAARNRVQYYHQEHDGGTLVDADISFTNLKGINSAVTANVQAIPPSFESVPAGTPAAANTVPVKLENTGDLPLNITNLQITGEDGNANDFAIVSQDCYSGSTPNPVEPKATAPRNSCTVNVGFKPTRSSHTSVAYLNITSNADDATERVLLAARSADAAVDFGDVGGDVPATLSLTLGAPASFGAFTPGIARVYEASTTANVISTAGDATLTVSDPSDVATGHLVNGTFALPQPLQAAGSALPATVKTYDAPVSNDVVTIPFTQAVGANDALRTGSYSKTLTFTLSTTTP